MALLLGAASPGRAEPILQAGQERLAAALIGADEVLPGGCRLSTGALDIQLIRAIYSCPSGKVVLDLRHSSQAGHSSTRTERFALSVVEGSPPPGFLDAVVARIRTHEQGFVWTESMSARHDASWQRGVWWNALLFLALGAVVSAGEACRAFRSVRRGRRVPWAEVLSLAMLTLVAAWLRFALASPNLLDHGGVPYMRLLRGTSGYWGTAQLYSFFYASTAADLEHAILANRILGTLTVPFVFALCRTLSPSGPGLAGRAWPWLAAGLFAVHPPHILFSASDALAIPSNFLAATSYLLLAAARWRMAHPPRRSDANDEPATSLPGRLGSDAWNAILFLCGGLGLCLLTQVRQEHWTFLLPALVAWIGWPRRWPVLAPGLVAGGGLLIFYSIEAMRVGLRYQPVRPGLESWLREAFFNDFLGLPVLLGGTIAVGLYRGVRLGSLALLAWLPPLFFAASIATGGHHAARVQANWLIFLLPIAALGFAQLLASPRASCRALGLLAVAWCGVQPWWVSDALGVRYLEIHEHDVLAQLLRDLPSSVRYVVVPDDNPESQIGTLEPFNKYASILAASPAAPSGVQLVGISQVLNAPRDRRCAEQDCLFFAGLPCQELGGEPAAPDCVRMANEFRLTPRFEATATTAPFLPCATYTGPWRRILCLPRVQTVRFTTYQIEP